MVSGSHSSETQQHLLLSCLMKPDSQMSGFFIEQRRKDGGP